MPRRSLAVAYAAAQRAAARSGLDLLVAVTADGGGHVVVVPRDEAEIIEPAVLDNLPEELLASHADVLAQNATRVLVDDARDARTRRGRVAAAWDALHGR